MKKTRKLTLIAVFGVLVLGLLGVGGYLLYHNYLAGQQTGNLAGVEWYSETEKEFTISTADELFEFAKLSEYYDFKSQTVKLDSDIVINEGNAEDWSKEAPARKWNPILQFAGTFDGQGHTISGVYAVGYMESVGMFAGTQRGCVIKNFKLVNSFFKNNGDMGTGSILAKGGGTVDTVYSDAIVVSTGWHTGGLVGTFTASGSNKITNCWFDGTLTMEMEYGRYAGGILGTVNALGAMNQIEHCLNTANITTSATSNPCIGGICGVVMTGGSLQLADNLNVGMITTARGIYGIGSILGRVVGKNTIVTIDNNYASSESYYTALGGSEGKVTGSSVRLRNVNLVGYEGYQWTELDFEKYWAVVMDDTPVLQSFADTIVDLNGVAKKIDQSWYTEDASEYTLTTAAQLFGFAELSRTIDFKDVTIKLGADIVCNEGKASDWAKEAPINIWKPIGYNEEYGGKTFLGTFDGQGHTISGLYGMTTKSMISFFGETGAGSIVKNLKIINSYFEAEKAKADSWGMVGGVVAKSWGTVDTVYSNAILVNSGTVTGGIVGMMRITGKDGGECIVRNCWYDGQITANGSTGGIVGDIYGCPTTVEHCLNTGSISTIKASGNIGGLVGIVEIQDAKLNLSDSVSVGKISDASKKSWNVGSAIGRVVKTEKVTNIVANIKNVYVSKEASGNALGNKTGNFTGTDIVRLAEADLIGTNGYFNTALNFYANGKGYWVAQEGKTPILKSFAKGKTLAVGGLRIDLSWYNKDADVYTIKDAAQLYGLRQLSESLDFKGKTIKLANDIVVNEGNASTWGEAAPTYSWKPIGYNEEFGGKTFQGTFDGQGYSISGLYGKTTKSMMSLFGEIGTNGVIKNLKVMNSYFEAEKTKSDSWGMVAGVVAKSWGTVDTVYSNATLVNSGTVTGGIVGMMRITGKVEGKCKVSNCWYDGVITANGSTGGIIGCVYGCEATIEHCLYTGKISTIKACGNIGGLCGIVEQKNGALNISDSLSLGSIKDASIKSWNMGSILGRAVKTETTNTVVNIETVYAAKEIGAYTIGNKIGNFNGSDIVRLAEADLKGASGYFNTALNFDVDGKGYWVAQADKTPMLKSFATGDILALGGMRADISWYNKNEDVYTIKDANQLYGLRQLSETLDFKGKTLQLANDIVVNEGDASTWGEKAPQYIWKPIGYNEEFGGKTFQGTFDGQGYTISGLYGKTTKSMMALFGEVGTNGVIKNLKVTNSYFEAEKTKSDSWGMVAGVVAKSWGTVDTVYSNATLVNNGTITGGIVGMMRITGKDDGACMVRNCWYDGVITANGSTGGIIGDVYGCEATIESCLFTGTINTIKASGNIGGLCGIVEQKDGALNLSDSLSVGTIKDTSDESWNVGSVLGRAVKTATTNTEVNIDNVYAAKEISGNAIGNKTGNFNGDDIIRVSKAELTGELSYLKTQLGFYVAEKNETGKWVVSADSTPVLKSFSQAEALDLTNALYADTSWYDKEPYEISTVSQLYGFAELSKTTDFAGKTITLTTSLTLNESDGSAETWGTNAPKYAWTPIEDFAGIFNGNMNTISGIYLKSNETGLGLFKEVRGTVQNLVLENSYIENTKTSDKGATGSVVGRLTGTLHTVKSSADVVLNGSEYAGGLVGDITQAGATIENCWFDGSVSGKGSHHGTLLGGLHETGASATITDCLSTGSIDLRGNTGGLVGALWDGATLSMKKSLFAGKFVDVGASVWNHGTITGNIGNGELTSSKVYSQKYSLVSRVLGNKGNNSQTGILAFEAEYLTGENGYRNCNLDFYEATSNAEGKWVVIEDTVPGLKAFADVEGLSCVDIKQVDITQGVRTAWYDDQEDEFTLMSAADFRGFQLLSQSLDFQGDTVKLGADIDLNPGWKASQYTWLDGNNGNKDTTQPSPVAWEPIGKSGVTSTTKTYPAFAGTFDGEMHQISGVRLSKWGSSSAIGLFGEVDGATIKNFILTNSHFYVSSSSENTYMGSVVGTLNGTVDTVKCDDTVFIEVAKVTNHYNGGIVGTVKNGVIKNSWFAGRISGNGYHQGGILGGLSASGDTCTIENCLFTGNIRLNRSTGGICGGVAEEAELTVINTLYAGKMSAGTGSSYKGLIVGNLAATGTITAENLYASKETFTKNIGWTDNDTEATANKTIDANVTHLAYADFDGITGYLNIDLDYYVPEDHEDGTWVIVENEAPHLKVFGDATGEQYIDIRTIGGQKGDVRTVWYKPTDDKDTFILYSAADFRGFQELSKTTNFAESGKKDTVKLGADIDLNPGFDASTYSWIQNKKTTRPNSANDWNPIGRSGVTVAAQSYPKFAGIFDGDMHSISGVFSLKWISGRNAIGLFGEVEGAAIKNFTLRNSYFYIDCNAGVQSFMGSVVGVLNGTLDTVKCDETVFLEVQKANEYNGGLVGKATNGSIQNCWFAGNISAGAALAHTGGLLGGLPSSGNKCTITNCLFTGKIEARANTGGLVGTAWTGSELTITKTLYAGEFVTVPNVNPWNIGTVMGVAKDNTSTATDVYVGIDSKVGGIIGSKGNNSIAKIHPLNRTTQLAGEEAYDNMNVDFYKKDVNENGVWYAVEGSHPVLRSFVNVE